MSFSLEMKRRTVRFLALLAGAQAAVAFPAAAGEVVLQPDGLNVGACWSLSRVGAEFSASGTYSYPDTTRPVRLYLIDTAVANPASFVAANPKLKFEGTILIRGSNDPAVSTPRAHGTQMLSLIAGVDTGVAPGTPIHLVNYDIYPTETTTTSLLARAIIAAVQHHKNSALPMRAAICVATSSNTQANSALVGDSINFALSEGIPVILSAGNLGLDASTIVPSSNGVKDGVICVGASNFNDARLSSSNFGAPVDVLAPGLDVRTRSQSATSPLVLMSGTSPATALVAGAVLAKLSTSPTHTPAGIESALKAAATATNLPVLRSVVAPSSEFLPPDVAPDGPVTPASAPVSLTWESIGLRTSSPATSGGLNPPGASLPATDTNSNGLPDLVETFHGDPRGLPAGPEVSLSADRKIEFKFRIEPDLFDEKNPFTLRNGHTWRIRSSSGLSSWAIPEGNLTKTTDAQGRAWLTASFPATQPACFARIEIVAP